MTLAYADEGSGRPLVFVHGMSGDREHWAPVTEILRDRYRCIRAEMPGHGESPADNCNTLGAAQELAATLEEAGIENPVLLGHSAGGYIVTISTLFRPAAGIIGADDPRSTITFAQTLTAFRGQLNSDDFEGAFRDWLFSTYPDDAVPEPTRSMVREHVNPDRDIVMSYWYDTSPRQAVESHNLLINALPNVRAPFLGIYGSPLKEPEKDIVDSIPDATVEIWDGYGHFVHLVDPQRFADRVVKFVETL